MVSSWIDLEQAAGPALTGPVLLQAVCRGRQPVAELRLPQPSRAASRRLVELVLALRSPAAPWPADLPQTAENLAPYIAEEVEEVAVALPAGNRPASSWPLAALIPQLLWAIASSGYELMRLLEGVEARLEADQRGTLQLVPLLTLTTQRDRWQLDLVSQRPPLPPSSAGAAAWVEGDRALQLIEGDLAGSPQLASQWLAAAQRQLAAAGLGLASLLQSGSTVELLFPGGQWQTAQISLALGLSFTPKPAVPPAPTELTLESLAGELAAATTSARAWLAPPAVAAHPDHEAALAAWITLTDEAWIHTFLQAVAQDLFEQQLTALQLIDRGHNPAAIVQAAYAVVSSVQGTDGLFQHTFIHRPMLLADLWPRLRWYLSTASAPVLQLMGGLPGRWLSPGAGWQQGQLLLQGLLQVQSPTNSWWLDLGSGQPLAAPPAAVPAGTVLMLPAIVGARPLPLPALERWLAAQLQPRSRILTALGQQPLAIDLHRLDHHQSQQPAQIRLFWQWVLQARP
jgi:hypothetical protein